jgi:hypothetical protein
LKAAFDHVLILTFEDFIQNTEVKIKEVYQFLGVDDTFLPENISTQFNPGGIYRRNPITNFIFQQSKLKSAVKQIIPLTPGMKKAKLKVIKRYKEATPPMDEKAEQYLIEIFSPDVQRLTQLGVNTSLWHPELLKKSSVN